MVSYATPRLLYISPVVPGTSGNGLAMRAGAVLRQLARRHEVSLLVVPLHASIDVPVPRVIAETCRRTAVCRIATSDPGSSPLAAAARIRWDEAGAMPSRAHRIAFHDEAFDVVHLYRIATLPHAMPFLFDPAAPVARHIDLDEAESASRRRLAGRYRITGQTTAAGFLDLEAGVTARVEREVLARFDRVYACSAAERDALPASAGRDAVRILPNVLDALDTPERQPVPGPFTFLFVGTLAYFPNADAVRFMCDDVLPRLRQWAPAPFRIVIVGAGANESIAGLARLPEVELTGGVADLDPWYERASAVIVPLRSGGGVRIKVLEAMRARRPIVSTMEGIRGTDLRPGGHVLVGDTADEFARQCVRLMREPALACDLRRRAYTLFALRHTPDAMLEALDG